MPPDHPPHPAAIPQAWSALGGPCGLLSAVTYDRSSSGLLPSRLPVLDAARACVAVCSLAAAEYVAAGGPVPRVRVDDGAVATAFVSERQLRLDGREPSTFAPLSRFWRTADGWVRTHANYPHHKAALLAALGVPEDRVERVLAGLAAVDVEERVYAAGGLAVALRTRAQWAAHPQGVAVAGEPLVHRERLDERAPRARGGRLSVARARGGRSSVARARGGRLRVLDLTRVLAGPVATRTLALLGADVLRVDSPGLPELADQHADTGFGKRSTLLDLARPTDRTTFDELLAEADLVVTGYRPGALDRLGLSPSALAERRPGVVVAQLNAWGGSGPWAVRRGFDSLVQVATGIADAERDPAADRPGALPAQALDHGTGYLLAAAVLRSLTEQASEPGSRLVRLSLARTADWLLRLPAARRSGGADSAYDPSPYLVETTGPLGRLRHARSPVSYEGCPANWARSAGVWGADAARWEG
ncbi:CoA transferase [Streptomyces sp. LHD-70]|uniref:CoA transferase n=1 Tax=Streptomyces sp. LHD-70 TaxID=3072140 RepID=UPI00280E5462|nr:CoA transferase [Streptomyces sp. LHD-70]MDQ8701799.1 CoA transferase [Streptomyces sp. LHD-70]